MAAEDVKKNDPAEWTRSWSRHDDASDMYGSHTYPRDGRETIFDPYEAFAPTMTVGEFKVAQDREHEGDPALPADFGDYLRQRVPNPRDFYSVEFNTPIDRFGNVGEPGDEDEDE